LATRKERLVRACWTQLRPNDDLGGYAAPATHPCGRDIWGQSFVHEGKLYIFGGAWNRYDPGDRPELDRLGAANDLWCFDQAADIWTLLESDDWSQPGQEGAQRPGARLLASFTVIGDDAYLFGGLALLERGFVVRALNDLWRYHLPSGRWELIHPHTGWCGFLNRPSHPPIRGAHGAAAIGHHLYIFGGCPFTAPTFTVNDLWRYDTLGRQWEQLSPWRSLEEDSGYDEHATYPGPRYCANFFEHGGSLYLFSGRDLDKTGRKDAVLFDQGPEFFNDLWRYDPRTDGWTQLHPDVGGDGPQSGAAYPSARYGSGHAVLGNDFYLFGGYDGGASELGDLWRYDIRADRWRELHPSGGAPNLSESDVRPAHRRVPIMEAAGDSLLLFGGLDFFLGPPERGFWRHPDSTERRAHPVAFNDLYRCDLSESST
jgi:N-acetylneuraminic acid mutarotase